ncbi:histidinol-phosphate transaminase [bacterium]|nr:histidinol-phosphate transaminase [bacterium]RQV95275.1 MAG: histidinol-phosphate transaminase [bacterium]
MQTPYKKESNKPYLDAVKPEVRALVGYEAPPQGKVIAKLNQNENPYDLPESMRKEILDEMGKQAWTRYPTYGAPVLQEKLAKRYKLNADQVLVGHGSNQLLYATATAIIAPDDPIVINPPSFSLFELITRIYRGRVVSVLQKEGFVYDTDKLLEAVRTAKLTMICSPNNPTGGVMELDLLERILERTPGLVLWDEAYGEFWGKSAIPLIGKHPNLLVMRTFSKAFGMAGIRIGYLMGDVSLIREIRKVIVPYNINLFNQIAATRMLKNSDWIETHIRKVISERQWLFDQMKACTDVIPYPSEANFISFHVSDGPDILNKLKEQGILIRNMGNYAMMENCLRVTVGKPKENRIFIKALCK